MRIDTYIYKTIYHTIMLKFDKENESKMNNKKDQTELCNLGYVSISFENYIMTFYDMFENMITPSSLFELIQIL